MNPARGALIGVGIGLALGWAVPAMGDAQPPQPLQRSAQPAPATPPSAQAREALQLLTSRDLYQQQLGFLRLEALREPATIALIKPYLSRREPELRAYSLRAVAAIEEVSSVPLLLEILKRDKSSLVRRAVLLGLEPFAAQDPQVVPALINALRDPKTDVRMTAVDIVSRLETPQAQEAILLRYQQEHRRDVRRVLNLAMRRIGR